MAGLQNGGVRMEDAEVELSIPHESAKQPSAKSPLRLQRNVLHVIADRL